MLEVKGIRASYDGVPALHDISLHIDEGEIVGIIGSNGAGKSTILKAISGLLRPDRGEIVFAKAHIEREKAHRIAALGVAHVPEGRRLFNRLTVWENLSLGAYTTRSQEELRKRMEWAFEIFPILRERQRQQAGTFSGGEQQMLAIARGLMLGPKLLMLDEPSLGVMPTMVTKILDVVREIRERGVTILLVEQNVRRTLELVDRAYVLQTGKIVTEGTGKELLGSDVIRKAYLGM